MSYTIDISKLDKADVLVALFNASKQQGMGFLDPSGPEKLSRTDAEAALKQGNYFDYFRGRVIKVDLSGNELEPRLYDRDNGIGAAAKALAPLIRLVSEKL